MSVLVQLSAKLRVNVSRYEIVLDIRVWYGHARKY